jgi:hypothetical protein
MKAAQRAIDLNDKNHPFQLHSLSHCLTLLRIHRAKKSRRFSIVAHSQ